MGGYAKKLTPYCGADPPRFEESSFDTGRPRWLMLYNNTLNTDQMSKSKNRVRFIANSIGYRRTASYDQKFYGKKCLCGLRRTSRPAKDPLLRKGNKTMMAAFNQQQTNIKLKLKLARAKKE